jgi:hypothetical protein
MIIEAQSVGRSYLPALNQLACDHVSLDLIGALADDHQRRVAEVALDIELAGIAVAAVSTSIFSSSFNWTVMQPPSRFLMQIK